MSFDDLTIKSDKKMVESDLVNHVVMIIDRSGSMQSLESEVPGAFNVQLRELKESSGNMRTTISLVTFSHLVDEPIYWKKDINQVKEITKEDYMPEGMTALYDAIGQTIERMNNDNDAKNLNTSFLFVVITDGCENNSKTFDNKTLNELMNKVKETNRWTFSFLGSNLDLEREAGNIGVTGTNSVYFMQSNAGIRYVGLSCASGTSGRSGTLGGSGISGGQSVSGYTPTGMTVTHSLDDALKIHTTSIKSYMDSRKNIKYDNDEYSVFSATNEFYNDAPDNENDVQS